MFFVFNLLKKRLYENLYFMANQARKLTHHSNTFIPSLKKPYLCIILPPPHEKLFFDQKLIFKQTKTSNINL